METSYLLRFLKRNLVLLHYLAIGTQCPGNLIRERNFALCVRTAVGALALPRNNGSAPAAFLLSGEVKTWEGLLPRRNIA